MNHNQRTGIMFIVFGFIMWVAPPLIIGIPVPSIIYLPLALIGMAVFIIGICCLAKVFEWN